MIPTFSSVVVFPLSIWATLFREESFSPLIYSGRTPGNNCNRWSLLSAHNLLNQSWPITQVETSRCSLYKLLEQQDSEMAVSAVCNQPRTRKLGSNSSYSFDPRTRKSQTQRQTRVCAQKRRAEKKILMEFLVARFNSTLQKAIKFCTRPPAFPSGTTVLVTKVRNLNFIPQFPHV